MTLRRVHDANETIELPVVSGIWPQFYGSLGPSGLGVLPTRNLL